MSARGQGEKVSRDGTRSCRKGAGRRRRSEAIGKRQGRCQERVLSLTQARGEGAVDDPEKWKGAGLG